MAFNTIHYPSYIIGILLIIAISSGSANGDKEASEWAKCAEMITVKFSGSECPFWCTDSILYDIACKPDGTTPINCSEGERCPKYFDCERIACTKSPCYEPNGIYLSFMKHVKMCKKSRGYYIYPTKNPWNSESTPDKEKPYNRSRKTDLISAVLPVMLIMVVIVTVIMVLRCLMRRRQARRFQGTAASGQERIVHNEPLITNNRYPKPNVTTNPICAGAIPSQQSTPQMAGASAQPTAPYPTLNYPHSSSINVVPYPSYSSSDNTAAYPPYPNTNYAPPYPLEMPEMPPNYSPHNENQQFPDTAPPTYFEAIRENQSAGSIPPGATTERKS